MRFAPGCRHLQTLKPNHSLLLDRIAELENAQQVQGGNPYTVPAVSTAYPRSLSHPNAQRRFLLNLDNAIKESELEDASVDPILQSKHVGPNARRRMEAEAKERMEEEQREARIRRREERLTREAAAGATPSETPSPLPEVKAAPRGPKKAVKAVSKK